MSEETSEDVVEVAAQAPATTGETTDRRGRGPTRGVLRPVFADLLDELLAEPPSHRRAMADRVDGIVSPNELSIEALERDVQFAAAELSDANTALSERRWVDRITAKAGTLPPETRAILATILRHHDVGDAGGAA